MTDKVETAIRSINPHRGRRHDKNYAITASTRNGILKNCIRSSIVIMALLVDASFADDAENAKIFDVLDYGAKNDDRNVDTSIAVQKALNDVKKYGKSSILKFPKGRYDFRRSGAVKKKYHVTNTSEFKE